MYARTPQETSTSTANERPFLSNSNDCCRRLVDFHFLHLCHYLPYIVTLELRISTEGQELPLIFELVGFHFFLAQRSKFSAFWSARASHLCSRF